MASQAELWKCMNPRERRTIRSGWVQRERIEGGFVFVKIGAVGSVAIVP